MAKIIRNNNEIQAHLNRYCFHGCNAHGIDTALQLQISKSGTGTTHKTKLINATLEHASQEEIKSSQAVACQLGTNC